MEKKEWEALFLLLKGEVEVRKVTFKENIGTVIYWLPYTKFDYEFEFDINDDQEKVKEELLDDIDSSARNMAEFVMDVADKSYLRRILNGEE